MSRNSLDEIQTFLERSAIALVKETVDEKLVNMDFFRRCIKEKEISQCLLRVEFPVHVDRWDGGSEDCATAVLTFTSKHGEPEVMIHTLALQITSISVHDSDNDSRLPTPEALYLQSPSYITPAG